MQTNMSTLIERVADPVSASIPIAPRKVIEMSIALLPCPICGGEFCMGQEPSYNHPVAGKFYIFHANRETGRPWCRVDVTGHFDTESEAVAFWNERPPKTAFGEICPDCGGMGEYFAHTADCDNDFCALAGDIDDCNGEVVECHCAQHGESS